MTLTFQQFADEIGATANFRMGSRSLSRLWDAYELWQRQYQPISEWHTGPIVGARSVGRGIVEMKLADNSVFEIRVRR
jgi:hypothetical protein